MGNKQYGTQSVCDTNKDRYAEFIDYGAVTPDNSNALASEASVFLLFYTRTHWKFPISYFLTDKMSAGVQAQLVRMALEKAAEAGLRIWSITANGTSVNISTFVQLGCTFGTTYEFMVTKFKHPTQDYYVYVVSDPCHMLKLTRNALVSLSAFDDINGGKIQWKFLQNLHNIQESEDLKLGNKLSNQHLQYEKRKTEC